MVKNNTDPNTIVYDFDDVVMEHLMNIHIHSTPQQQLKDAKANPLVTILIAILTVYSLS